MDGGSPGGFGSTLPTTLNFQYGMGGGSPQSFSMPLQYPQAAPTTRQGFGGTAGDVRSSIFDQARSAINAGISDPKAQQAAFQGFQSALRSPFSQYKQQFLNQAGLPSGGHGQGEPGTPGGPGAPPVAPPFAPPTGPIGLLPPEYLPGQLPDAELARISQLYAGQQQPEFLGPPELFGGPLDGAEIATDPMQRILDLGLLQSRRQPPPLGAAPFAGGRRLLGPPIQVTNQRRR